MVKQFLTLINNVRTLVEAITTSAGAADADKIVATNAAGVIDITLLPSGIGANTKSIQASEALSAGDFINIHNSGGARVRLADATDNTKPAHGYVIDNVLSGAMATVYFDDINTGLSGLTIGETYALSTTPGDVVALSAAAAASGNIIQQLGVAISATEMEVAIKSYDEIG